MILIRNVNKPIIIFSPGYQQTGSVDQSVKPTPVLPPGAFTSSPPDVLLGQPGFGGLEGEDPLQSASLPQDEFLVRLNSFHKRYKIGCLKGLQKMLTIFLKW